MLQGALENKKILILGFGREGQDTFLFLRKKFPKKIIGIADQAPDAVASITHGRRKLMSLHLGKRYLDALKKYDVIIKSPGISPFKIAPFLTKKQIVTSQTEIFFDECPGTIIGITGTKGKSTTASLIHAVLRAGRIHSYLIGNIGNPVLKYLKNVPLRGISRSETKPEDVFVYELSSFQLESLNASPHIAVFLNLYPEHLDHHKTFGAYAKAKTNITKHQTQTDFLIYNAKDPLVAKIAKESKAQKIPFSPGAEGGLSPRGGTVPPIASVKPAIIIGKLFGISQKKIQQAIKQFKPLPHRLEKVGEWKGITFYNDSLATIPEAAMSALDSLGAKVHTLIAGGYDRGVDMKKLAQRIEKSSVQTLIVFPDTGIKILRSLKKRPKNIFQAETMREAVRLAFEYTPKNKTCLLSPAASSFNMFKDYKDRGEQFTKFAKRYGEKA